ncbi:hypothetical protein [Streptomyces sp. NBC_01483]|uniref:hypothetical protein n=1 Tax=Streptomyces sp. NBC_01483 TaxID=2903883 RepID=UPI002E316DF7|nr:hypothetical protein [Streptomyces sp. NBC_01483]
MTDNPHPLTEQQLDEIEKMPRAEDIDLLVAEVRRLRTQMAAVHGLCDEQDQVARMLEFATPPWIGAVRAVVQSADVNEMAASLRRDGFGPDQIATMLRSAADEAQQPETARWVLTPNEHDRAWHAIEGAAGDPGADPGTVLNAVLRALRIDAPTAEDEQAASPRRKADGTRQDETLPAEDPARIDRVRPEFTDHASVESIDVQLRRARSQQRRWHLRVEWLISLRQARVEQKARGEWPAS